MALIPEFNFHAKGLATLNLRFRAGAMEVAKRIVQEIHKSGFIFKKHPDKNATYYSVPVDPGKDKNWNKRLSLVEVLNYLHHELDLVKKRIYHNTTEGGGYS